MSDSFYGYFRKNMEAMGLPAPATLFGSLQTATGTVSTIVGVVGRFGTRVTVGELIGAGTLGEGLLVASGVLASFYAGACVGSLAVATGQKLSGGLTIADAVHAATLNGIQMPGWLRDVLVTEPRLLGRRSGAGALHRR